MVMDGNARGGAPRFSVGAVVSTSLSVLFANVWSFLLIILAVGVPMVVLIAGASMVMAAGGGAQGETLNLGTFGGAQVVLVIFIFVVGMLAYLLMQAAITHGTLQSLRGRKAGVGTCLSTAFSALPRIFVAALIFVLVIAIVGGVLVSIITAIVSSGGIAGGILGGLVVGAALIFVVVQFWVLVPAILVEGVGPITGFTRSYALTKGRRWGIFGILALVGIANWVISLLGRLLAEIAPVASGVIDVAAGLFFMALSAVLAAVGYTFLRAEKEGVAIDDVVTVFD